MSLIATLATTDWVDCLKGLMQRGGPVMWPILVCSLIAVAITLRKFLMYACYHVRVRYCASEWHTALALLTEGKQAEVQALGRRAMSPYTRLLYKALQAKDETFNVALERLALHQVRCLKRGLGVLDTIVTLSPLLGILGTVTGIIHSFNLLGATGIADPMGVSVGIAEALITTAAGLIVSILALVPLNMGRTMCKEMVRDLEVAMTQAQQRHTIADVQ